MKLTLDIGGTNIRAGFFSGDGTLMRKEKTSTPTQYEEGIQKIYQLAKNEGVNAIAIAIAGVLDKAKGVIITSPNLTDWVGKPMVADIAKKFALPEVVLENDAAAAALGEAHFGAGKEKHIIVYITLGTGVGGARIVDGKLDSNAMGFEPGNQTICFDESRDVSPFRKGTLESYVSGTAFQRLYGVSASSCTDPSIWEKYARHLSVGLANIMVLWSPDVVILGGGLSQQASKFLPSLQEMIPTLVPFPQVPPIVVAALGDDAALFGGLTLL